MRIELSVISSLLLFVQLCHSEGSRPRSLAKLTLRIGSPTKRFGIGKFFKPRSILHDGYMKNFYNPFWYGGPLDGGDLYDGPFGGFAPNPFAKPKLFKTAIQTQTMPMKLMMSPVDMTPPMSPPMGGMTPMVAMPAMMTPMMGMMMAPNTMGMMGDPNAMGMGMGDPDAMGMGMGDPNAMGMGMGDPNAMGMGMMDPGTPGMTMTPVMTPMGMSMMMMPNAGPPPPAPAPPAPVVKTNIHVHNVFVPPYDDDEPYEDHHQDDYYRR